jgi:S1-C subfamily serine protease
MFTSDTRLKAKLIGIDEQYRVGFIQITEEAELPDHIEFESGNEFHTGDEIYLIQHLSERFNREIIISDHRINAIIDKPLKKLLTTCSFVPNSAGGIAVNREGLPVGVVFRGRNFVPSFDYEFDFSSQGSLITQILPGYYLTRLVENPPQMQLQKNGTGKSWLGIRMQILKKDMADYWNISGTRGIIINSVLPQSPAEKAGLQVGDIVTGINGFSIQGDENQDLELFRNYIRSLPEGPVQLSFIRNQNNQSVNVSLESAPISKFFAEEYSEEFLRFSVKELTRDIILENDLDFDIEGVWVSRVEEAGAASLSGLMVQDLILNINDMSVKNLAEFKKIMTNIQNQAPSYVQLFVRRANKTLFLFVKTSYANNHVSED